MVGHSKKYSVKVLDVLNAENVPTITELPSTYDDFATWTKEVFPKRSEPEQTFLGLAGLAISSLASQKISHGVIVEPGNIKQPQVWTWFHAPLEETTKK